MASENTIRLSEAELKLVDQLRSLGAEKSAEKFKKSGLPSRRIEAYHYTDLKVLLRDFPDLATATSDRLATAPQFAGAFRLVTINGEIQESSAAPENLYVSETFDAVLESGDDVLVSLNRAMVKKSLVLKLEGEVSQLVHIDHQIVGRANHAAGAIKIELAANASATIVETFSGTNETHVGNHATRIELAAGARLTHIVVNLSSKQARHFHTIEYGIGANVRLRNLIVNSGSALSRTQMFGVFAGEHSHADFFGLNLVDENQHNDITLDITHAVPNTTSQEMFKSVVRNTARAIFQGRIVVAPGAQKTDAKMMAQGLMLSEGAQILTKPELEIFADDVQCGHGSTCGELDTDSMFYLMSRGVSPAEAKAMLIRGFIEELIDPITQTEIKSIVSKIIDNWLDADKTGETP